MKYIILSLILLVTGCATVHIRVPQENKEPIEAKIKSYFWDRQIEGLKYNVVTHELSCESFKTGSDSDSIIALTKTIDKLVMAYLSGGATAIRDAIIDE